MEVDDLREELAKGKLRPVYVLVGPERWRIDRAVAAIRKVALDDATAAWNLELFAGKDGKAVKILAAARTPPMMGRGRFVLVRDADALEATELDALAPYLEDPSPTTTMVLLAERIDGRRKLAAVARKTGAWVEAPNIPERALPAWSMRIAKAQGHDLDGAAATALVDCCGADLYLLDDAIQRLGLYVGEGRPITAAAVGECIAPLRAGNVFELVDAIGRRQTPRALSLLGQLLDAREPGLRILWWMARHVRQLVVARETTSRDLPGKLGVPPFVADKLAQQARGFSTGKLEQALDVLSATDLDLKGAKRTERLILEEAVLRLCGA
jgi:DNA polymerase-3 subunit delta